MRITFVLPHAGLAGGIRVLAEFAQRLQVRGHRVSVVSVPERGPTWKERATSLLKHHRWLPSGRRGASHFDGATVQFRVLESHRAVRDADLPDADVVIATWWETAEWVARLSPTKGAKAYYIQLDERAVMSNDRRWGQRVAETWRLPLYKIATSGTVKHAVEDVVGGVGMPVVRIGVDMQHFNALPRGKHAIPRVGFLYEPTPRKGPDVALKVVDLVQKELSATEFAVLSSSKQVAQFSFPLNTFVHVQPSTDELRKLYAACDLWLCTSRCEGFHLPPMEAMACRCPVVSTRVGGPVDMVEDGVNGYLADVDDVAELVRRVLQILHLPESGWRSMSDAAYETARAYSWEDSTTLFEQALRAAIDGVGPRELVGMTES